MVGSRIGRSSALSDLGFDFESHQAGLFSATVNGRPLQTDDAFVLAEARDEASETSGLDRPDEEEVEYDGLSGRTEDSDIQ